jgi:hypothetical protein
MAVTGQAVIDVHRHQVTVEVSDEGPVIIDTDQGVAVVLWPDDALALAEQLVLAAIEARRTVAWTRS